MGIVSDPCSSENPPCLTNYYPVSSVGENAENTRFVGKIEYSGSLMFIFESDNIADFQGHITGTEASLGKRKASLDIHVTNSHVPKAASRKTVWNYHPPRPINASTSTNIKKLQLQLQTWCLKLKNTNIKTPIA